MMQSELSFERNAPLDLPKRRQILAPFKEIGQSLKRIAGMSSFRKV
jgi:hypothetical protein